jgi:hypothetical protein
MVVTPVKNKMTRQNDPSSSIASRPRAVVPIVAIILVIISVIGGVVWNKDTLFSSSSHQSAGSALLPLRSQPQLL